MKNDPRQITARFDSCCAETGRKIRKGDECVWYPLNKRIYHMDSSTAEGFRRTTFDWECLGGSY